jgi:transcriptional regulator with XRE-family HTH domain
VTDRSDEARDENREDIREFLATRRARLTPAEVGLPAGSRRRVPGLRREEVAVLAGVSTEWYTRLEKGHIAGVSEEVLDAVAAALRLDEAEHIYLFDLARAARPRRRPTRRKPTEVPEQIRWMLDTITGSPAIVANGRLDLLATNPLGRALYSPLYAGIHAGESGPPNIARYQFLDPSAAGYYVDWDAAANVTVALLRTEAGRDPHNKELRDLIGELSTVSDEFRTRWATHNVRLHHGGKKQFNHPDVGVVDLAYHTMDISTHRDRALALTVYTAEPGTDSEDRLKLLGSWAATHAAHVDTDADAPRGSGVDSAR